MSITPVFLFSLPRSGSTLVQRVISAHDGVATTAEPWILLPLLGPLSSGDPLARSWDTTVASAIEDFLHQLPHGRDDYDAAARRMALDLYERASPPGTRFFVDKTPPYHLVIDDIVRAFPAARFIVLWRHPLSVVASIVETLCGGRWETSRHRGALFHGIDQLACASSRHGERIHAVRFEDLVAGDTAWRAMLDYIGLDFDRGALERFADVRPEGRMGDPTGVNAYRRLSTEPLTKWRETVNTPVRRAWARRYVEWLGRERLALMGYDIDALRDELDALPVSWAGTGEDARDVLADAGREILRARMPGNRLASSVRLLASPRRT